WNTASGDGGRDEQGTRGERRGRCGNYGFDETVHQLDAS
ncbi:MAG: hypothetical protein QOK18_246, partial [Mycobacterium sp.]|nr:hypothetical protein [Mycobacterium sp.]